jgi:hypothetical protein
MLRKQTPDLTIKRRISLLMALLGLGSIVWTPNAWGAPIIPLLQSHGLVPHMKPLINTEAEFYDNGSTEVIGEIIALVSGGPGSPITSFTVKTTVFNNSGYDWAYFLFAYEYAQHSPKHWIDERYSLPVFEPAPVLNPNPNGHHFFTPYPIPVYQKTRLPDVPARFLGALRDGDWRTFTDSFTIDQGGARLVPQTANISDNNSRKLRKQ